MYKFTLVHPTSPKQVDWNTETTDKIDALLPAGDKPAKEQNIQRMTCIQESSEFKFWHMIKQPPKFLRSHLVLKGCQSNLKST